MNLKSCNNCGVVLDLSKMTFITEMDEFTPMELVEWDGDCYRPVVQCPVCKSDISNKDIKL